jgi:hypothetical protein
MYSFDLEIEDVFLLILKDSLSGKNEEDGNINKRIQVPTSIE